MKKLLTLAAATAALALGSVASAVPFDYANLQNASVRFNGDGTFNFVNGGNHFQVTSGPADLIGLQGNITGVYTIGPGVNNASVTGSGTFNIDDGAGNWFSADLVWETILRQGAVNGLNYLAEVNLTNFSYGGVNASLLGLLADGSAINTLTFQFAATGTLENLRTVAQNTSFSGTVTSVPPRVPDGGATAALLGLVLVGFSFAARRRLA
jgi:hypothetical protein